MPSSNTSSPRRGVVGATNRRANYVPTGSMPATLTPRAPESLSPRGLSPRVQTPREGTVRGSLRGVPQPLKLAESRLVDNDHNLRREKFARETLNDVTPYRSIEHTRKPEFQRPTVLEIGPRASSMGSDLNLRRRTQQAADLAPKDGDLVTHRTAEDQAMLLVRKHNQAMGTVNKKVLDGHAEAAIAVMREFFQNRPHRVLLDVLKEIDTDKNGSVDMDEFKRGLGRLNLDLSERDVKAVFRAVDKDGSGEIDLDEFFNCFRTDSFARDTFFWSSTRPKGMLTHDERIKTQNRLNGNTLQREYTPEEILGTIQSKVQQLNAKTVFNTLDDNRSGRVNVRELVGALGEVCARNTHPPTHPPTTILHHPPHPPIRLPFLPLVRWRSTSPTRRPRRS